jgi:methylated-DNA-[protein]-cysteine S-methyltransferase
MASDTGATQYAYLDSPIGRLLLAGRAGALSLIYFLSGRGRLTPDPAWQEDPRSFAEARRQLEAYFAGRLEVFDLPLALDGTPFQVKVWHAVAEIPYGQTRAYGEVARRIRRPNAVRAVGAANGQNPLPIVIPCHRVIGSNGSLTGYGGGLPIKRALLALESRQRSLVP